MPRISRPLTATRRPTALVWLAACALIAGCAEDEQTPAPRQPDQTYTVRGQIRQLPDEANPASGLQIQHEIIPEFVSKEGEVIGMNPMIMPFTPAPDLDLSEHSVGDKVNFTFDVDWDGAPLFQVNEMEPLPADTELDFSAPAEAPAETPPDTAPDGG